MGSIVKRLKLKPLSLILPLAFSLCFSLLSSKPADPTPAPWPHQFHSILFMNNNGSLQVVDLWYDWTNGRNFNIIQNQLGKLLYDLEWDNGTSYIYTLDSNQECRVLLFPVGVLRPNWLEGATYLGQQEVDGFLCNVWQKVDFIWYYEDVITKRPVHWVFYTGMTAHVMTFEVGAVLEDPKWQAPVYCFKESEKENAVFKSVDIAENLTAMHLKRCDRGKHCLYEGSTPPGWFPNSQSGATCCTLELAILKNNETRTWDRGSDDDGNQVWGVKEGPCESSLIQSLVLVNCFLL